MSQADFVLTHGHRKIKVKFAPEEEMNDVGGALLESNTYFYGLFKCDWNTIFINKDRTKDEHFPTLIHEIGEYICTNYGLEMNHECLSTFTRVFSDILLENRERFKKLL